MTDEEFKALREGDVVQHVSSGEGYIITGDLFDCKIATRTLEISNPPEWVKVER